MSLKIAGLIWLEDKRALVISARDMTPAERKAYEKR